MVHDAAEGLRSQCALPDAGMAVLMCAAGIQVVVQMDGFQLVKVDDLVELVDNAVKIVRYVVIRVLNMVRI